MLEHPIRFVNEFIHHDDNNDSEVDHTRSQDQASATPTPPTANDVREDTPTLDCATGGICGVGGDEGVKVNIDGGPIQDDLTSATPLENSK